MAITRDEDAFYMNRTGERLNHLLDLIGFKIGRGRIPEFQKYIKSKVPDLQDIKYSTVRSWFNNNAPPMKKINLIINSLQNDYDFAENIEQVKVWWKLGGTYPFKKNSEAEVTDNAFEKLNFLITLLVTEACGHDFSDVPSSSLVVVKDKAIALAKDFADPRKREVPIEYLRIFIADELRKNIT